MIVAIYPDDYTDPATGKCDASSPRWAELLTAAGHQVRWVDVLRPDILDQVKGCHGFMWRHGHFPQYRQIARRLLPVLEGDLGLAVYPDQPTCWHYDDKIAQFYLLSAHQIPIPKTWVWYDRDQALAWLPQAPLPLVCKLWSGAGSANVAMIQTLDEAKRLIDRAFGRGLASLNAGYDLRVWGVWPRMRCAGQVLLKGKTDLLPRAWELHKGYVLFQEFLPDNPFDTRITVIGNRAFGFRRFNRDGDFRASGSGKLDVDPRQVDPRTVRLACRVAEQLQTQSVAIDGLRRGDEPVVGEITYAYASWAVRSCPGHWEKQGAELIWKPGPMWPEEAQVADFLARLEKRT